MAEWGTAVEGGEEGSWGCQCCWVVEGQECGGGDVAGVVDSGVGPEVWPGHDVEEDRTCLGEGHGSRRNLRFEKTSECRVLW